MTGPLVVWDPEDEVPTPVSAAPAAAPPAPTPAPPIAAQPPAPQKPVHPFFLPRSARAPPPEPAPAPPAEPAPVAANAAAAPKPAPKEPSGEPRKLHPLFAAARQAKATAPAAAAEPAPSGPRRSTRQRRTTQPAAPPAGDDGDDVIYVPSDGSDDDAMPRAKGKRAGRSPAVNTRAKKRSRTGKLPFAAASPSSETTVIDLLDDDDDAADDGTGESVSVAAQAAQLDLLAAKKRSDDLMRSFFKSRPAPPGESTSAAPNAPAPHPFFSVRSKAAQPPPAAAVVDDVAPTSGPVRRIPASTAGTGFVPKKSVPATPVGLSLPWPGADMVHVNPPPSIPAVERDLACRFGARSPSIPPPLAADHDAVRWQVDPPPPSSSAHLRPCSLEDAQAQLDALPASRRSAASTFDVAELVRRRSESDASAPWTVRYAPQRAGHVLGHRAHAERLTRWLADWQLPTKLEAEIGRKRASSGAKKQQQQQPKRKKRRRQRLCDLGSDLDDFVVDDEDDESGVSTDAGGGGSQWDADDADEVVPAPRSRARVVVDDDDDKDGEYCDSAPSSSRRKSRRAAALEQVDQLNGAYVLAGAPGVGKSALVYAAAREAGFTVFEVNTGSPRGAKDVEALLGEIVENHTVVGSGVGQSVAILIEDADVVFDEDRGLWLGVAALAAKARRPIIITCSDAAVVPTDQFQIAHSVTLSPVPAHEIAAYAHAVLVAEGTPCDLASVQRVVDGMQPLDVRAALNNIQFLARAVSDTESAAPAATMSDASDLGGRLGALETWTAMDAALNHLSHRSGREHPLDALEPENPPPEHPDAFVLPDDHRLIVRPWVYDAALDAVCASAKWLAQHLSKLPCWTRSDSEDLVDVEYPLEYLVRAGSNGRAFAQPAATHAEDLAVLATLARLDLAQLDAAEAMLASAPGRRSTRRRMLGYETHLGIRRDKLETLIASRAGLLLLPDGEPEPSPSDEPMVDIGA
ncbi:hypothetical protein H9P43_001663 [Blastocladiella emersonii ATCC 22665]|nr:hypothetical protein H9P43_001663 [Blastocladiella emersonii ATCC 22665]